MGVIPPASSCLWFEEERQREAICCTFFFSSWVGIPFFLFLPTIRGGCVSFGSRRGPFLPWTRRNGRMLFFPGSQAREPSRKSFFGEGPPAPFFLRRRRPSFPLQEKASAVQAELIEQRSPFFSFLCGMKRKRETVSPLFLTFSAGSRWSTGTPSHRTPILEVETSSPSPSASQPFLASKRAEDPVLFLSVEQQAGCLFFSFF